METTAANPPIADHYSQIFLALDILFEKVYRQKKKKKKKEKTTNLTPDTVRLKKSEKSELIGELANLTGVKNFAALL